MKRSFHSRASRDVRPRRQSAALRSIALSVERDSASVLLSCILHGKPTVAALQALAQREGHSCMNTSTAYTVKHIQTHSFHLPSLMGGGMILEDADFNDAFCSHLDNKGIGKGWKAK